MGKLADNPPVRIVNRTRILTEEQIANLSERSLRSYFRTICKQRDLAHGSATTWCCTPKSTNCYVVETRGLTPEEVETIRAFDYAFAACRRECIRRQHLTKVSE